LQATYVPSGALATPSNTKDTPYGRCASPARGLSFNSYVQRERQVKAQDSYLLSF
jgi:hypothetical protein